MEIQGEKMQILYNVWTDLLQFRPDDRKQRIIEQAGGLASQIAIPL
jgi:hypothetical protein